MKRNKIYTVIVGRPDYVSDDQLTDTYMTSLRAANAHDAGNLACEEAAEIDSEDQDESNDPADYVVVATMRGQCSDITGREDL